LQVPVGSAPPASTGEHVPAEADSAQDMHVPLHADRQQTPCAQVPEAHSTPSLHAAPGDLSPHEPSLHTEGAAQSASEAQVPLHTEAPHLKGAQELAAGVTHAPAPSQAEAGV
jgi:hypothetical protein